MLFICNKVLFEVIKLYKNISLFEREITRKNSYELRKIKEGDIIPLVSDIMFQTMMNNESRKKYVAYLLSLILEEDFNKVNDGLEFMKDNLDKDNYHDSRKTVDLVCRLDDKIYNIEMNNNCDVSRLERNISYLGDLFKSQMKIGNKYSYNNVIQININNFSFKDKEEVIEKYYISNEENEKLTNKVQFIYIYLPKIREKYYNKEELSELEKLLLIFNEESSDSIEEMLKGNDIMAEYRLEAQYAGTETNVIGVYDKEATDEMLRQMVLSLDTVQKSALVHKSYMPVVQWD